MNINFLHEGLVWLATSVSTSKTQQCGIRLSISYLFL